MSGSRKRSSAGRSSSGLPLLSLDPNDKTGKTGKTFGAVSLGPHTRLTLLRSRDPEHPPLEETIRSSHVQRANHHDPFPGGAATPANHRIYRQGYPFLEPLPDPRGFRVGLNFVSFQSTPSNLTGMLEQVGWLENTNFGGDKPILVCSPHGPRVSSSFPREDESRALSRRARLDRGLASSLRG